MKFSDTIFMTGFPGFIAGRLVEQLAGPSVQFYLLVQSNYIDDAVAGINEIAEETGTPLENFAIVEGDITLPDLGMSPEDLATVMADTTDVHHLAAIYDLEVAKDLAYKVNVQGTQNVNDLCRSIPGLRRYNYVSTCYVAGLRAGVIRENELEHDAGFRNYYEETKYLAELEVERLKEEIPVTIFRPSVVVGDSRTGETAKYDGIYSLINYLKVAPNLLRFVNVGNDIVRLNLVPVDFVVKGIAALAKDAAAIGRTVALADPEPLTTAELFDTIAEGFTQKRSVVKPPPGLVESFLNSKISPPVTGLPHSGVPYFFVSQTYDTSEANLLLDPHRVECPNFRKYAPNLLKFVVEHPRL